MKKIPFDLEKAKAGAKLVTRDGRLAKIICFDRTFKINQVDLPIVAFVKTGENEQIHAYRSDGMSSTSNHDSDDDLFILEEPMIRPYANAKEVLEAMKQHGPMMKNKNNGGYYAMLEVNNDSVGFGVMDYALEELQEFFTWQDGHPCGVEEGGNNE